MSFLIMNWVAFLIGVGTFLFFVIKKIPGPTASQISAMLLFPTALILTSILAPNLTGLKLGPQGVEFNLELAKKAAAEVVKKDPLFAEALTAKRGQEAVAAAQSRISTVNSWADLERVMSFKLRNGAIIFYPKVNNRQVPVEVDAKGKVDVLMKDDDWKQQLQQEPRRPTNPY